MDTITWREMAARLAARVECQIHEPCIRSGDGVTGSNHNPPIPDTCPYCADREAYRQWVRKEAGMINGRRRVTTTT